MKTYTINIVSILTGPRGPVQPATARLRRSLDRFQSSPAPVGRCNRQLEEKGNKGARHCFNPHRPPWAGATICRCFCRSLHSGFNPHRPPWAGATKRYGGRSCAQSAGFNPHRPPWAGATPTNRATLKQYRRVSILTGPRGPVQPRLPPVGRRLYHVSILTGPRGPVQPSVCPPAPRGGGEHSRAWRRQVVSILTGPRGPVQPSSP